MIASTFVLAIEERSDWLRDGKQCREAADRGSFAAEGPSRPASCDTARPDRRAGQPQKNKKRGRE
ncbi:hypothetical protein SGRA_3074 [Saprospira grandis str. Lewin]|uniref:Uncharacterized protein n=1 Tax=Saprospira grandis (strain Lewin) TaxID=984262 RepID=H6KZM6_SAPGL|nr:hypothetical protein SGRA_3074 [Saprospira grandis str. Lewin]